MRNFFTTENCKRTVHAFVLLCSLFDHSVHMHVEHEFELVLAHARPRRSVARTF